MKTAAILLCFAVSALCQVGPDRRLTVCLQPYGDTVQAREVASNLFAEIGVRLNWKLNAKVCPEDGVEIRFSTHTADSQRPGALAYAMPYTDSAVVVFYDRVTSSAAFDKRLFSRLLGHVLAHEIGHVLQRVDRHSDTGVMKAKWKTGDYLDMASSGLRFEEFDRDLIREGLDARAKAEMARAVRSK